MSSERIGYTISSGSLITSGITAGNINFTGSLYQNGAVYSPSTSLKGFQVSATTGNSLTPPYVAVGSGANTIAYSSDGISWTGVTGTSIFSSYGYGVAYSSALSRWVAVGSGTNTIAYSSDGITWTGLGMSIFSSEGRGVAYSAALSRWVAVGGGTNSIAYSSDGITWTGLGMSIFSNYGLGVAYNGSNRWVAVGNGTNSIAYSSNGISWTGIGTSILSGYGYGVASNGSTSSSLIVTGQRVQYDTNSNYNNTTGTFTAPSSGIYIINLSGVGYTYITSANTFIPTQGNYTTNAYISAGNTLKCVVSGGAVYNWGVNYL